MERGDDFERDERQGPEGQGAGEDREATAAEDRDSAKLMARAQAGETDAFGTLYTRYFDRIQHYLQVMLGHVHDAEDAAQQTFLKAFEALASYDSAGGPFRGWLFAIARNHAIDHLRKESAVEVREVEEIDRLLEEQGLVEPEPEILNWIADHELLMFVERLPLAQRQAIVLRHVHDLPNEQIAGVLGLKEGHVRVLQHRGLHVLRKRLEAVGRGPDGERPPDNNARTYLRQAPVLRARRWSL